MKFTILFFATTIVAMAAGCKASQTPGDPVAVPAPQKAIGAQSIIPKAVIYKAAPEYRDKVPVRVNAQGKLLSYPAPSDIPANPLPLSLADGWYISPVGIDNNTVFTTYTYKDYRNLVHAPTPEEIEKAIITGSRVSETAVLPISAQEALSDTAKTNKLIISILH